MGCIRRGNYQVLIPLEGRVRGLGAHCPVCDVIKTLLESMAETAGLSFNLSPPTVSEEKILCPLLPLWAL